MNVLDQPIREVRQGLARQLVGEAFFDVLKAREDVNHRLRLPSVVEELPGEKRVHAGCALRDVEVEGTRAELLGEDEVGELRLLLLVLEVAVEVDQQQSRRRQALLAVDDELLPILVADDDGA